VGSDSFSLPVAAHVRIAAPEKTRLSG